MEDQYFNEKQREREEDAERRAYEEGQRKAYEEEQRTLGSKALDTPAD
jgi:hypothetical protein